MLVVNASRKDADWAHIEARLPAGVRLMKADNRSLLALQGPKAAEVLERHAPGAAALGFMSATSLAFDGIACHVSRSGYTGEDGFELSVKSKRLEAVAEALLSEPEVKPIGLGARDSLRLEAGLCLYGHDIDETTSPVEGALVWSMQKRRREEGGCPGFERIRRELAEGPSRVRVGLLPEGRAPAREGAEIALPDGRIVGRVTSGGFGPTVNGPVAMGYVEAALAAPGTELALMVRGKALPAKVAGLPFVPHRYARAPR
jgi:aminomethyltransferase